MGFLNSRDLTKAGLASLPFSPMLFAASASPYSFTVSFLSQLFVTASSTGMIFRPSSSSRRTPSCSCRTSRTLRFHLVSLLSSGSGISWSPWNFCWNWNFVATSLKSSLVFLGLYRTRDTHLWSQCCQRMPNHSPVSTHFQCCLLGLRGPSGCHPYPWQLLGIRSSYPLFIQLLAREISVRVGFGFKTAPPMRGKRPFEATPQRRWNHGNHPDRGVQRCPSWFGPVLESYFFWLIPSLLASVHCLVLQLFHLLHLDKFWIGSFCCWSRNRPDKTEFPLSVLLVSVNVDKRFRLQTQQEKLIALPLRFKKLQDGVSGASLRWLWHQNLLHD